MSDQYTYTFDAPPIDLYTIDPFNKFFNDIAVGGQGCLIAGDVIDMLTGATIVGPYCEWPKRENRYLIVAGIEDGSIYVECINEINLIIFDEFKERYVDLNKKALDLFNKTKTAKMLKKMVDGSKKKDWQHRYPWEK